MVYPIIYRVSTILLVVQDFATIHRMIYHSRSRWLRSGPTSTHSARLKLSPSLPDLLLSTLETHMLCKSPCYQAAGLGPAYSAALLCECVGHGYFSCLSPLHLMYVSAVPGSRNCSPRSIICKYKIAMCISMSDVINEVEFRQNKKITPSCLV